MTDVFWLLIVLFQFENCFGGQNPSPTMVIILSSEQNAKLLSAIVKAGPKIKVRLAHGSDVAEQPILRDRHFELGIYLLGGLATDNLTQADGSTVNLSGLTTACGGLKASTCTMVLQTGLFYKNGTGYSDELGAKKVSLEFPVEWIKDYLIVPKPGNVTISVNYITF